MTGEPGAQGVERLRALAGHAARRGIAWLSSLTGASARARARLDGSCAAVLMYHRVLPRAEALRLHVEPGMYVTPETFARHLDWLARDFEVVALATIVEALRDGRAIPRRACAITFDDGWRDNLVYAAPRLAERRIPATIFVVTDRVGTTGGFWPDEFVRRIEGTAPRDRRALFAAMGLSAQAVDVVSALAELKTLDEATRALRLAPLRRATRDPADAELELLDWRELDLLVEAGFAVESHAATHAILTGIADEAVQDELARSLAALRARGHGRHALLAYPSGGHDSDVVEIARRVGYQAAFTTQNGLVSAKADPLRQPRVAVHDDISRTHSEFLRFVPGTAQA